MTDPADYIDLVTGGEGGLTEQEAHSIADRVIGSDREGAAAVNALADSILRGSV